MTLDPNLTAAYIVLATALAVSPGPDVLFAVAIEALVLKATGYLRDQPWHDPFPSISPNIDAGNG